MIHSLGRRMLIYFKREFAFDEVRAPVVYVEF